MKITLLVALLSALLCQVSFAKETVKKAETDIYCYLYEGEQNDGSLDYLLVLEMTKDNRKCEVSTLNSLPTKGDKRQYSRYVTSIFHTANTRFSCISDASSIITKELLEIPNEKDEASVFNQVLNFVQPVKSNVLEIKIEGETYGLFRCSSKPLISIE